MSDTSTRAYEPPEVTEFGSVEEITENKREVGDDADCPGIALAGSAPGAC